MKFAFMRADDTTFATVDLPMGGFWSGVLTAAPESLARFYRAYLSYAVGADPKAFQGIDPKALEARAVLTGDSGVFDPQELELEEFEALTVAVWGALDARVDFQAWLAEFLGDFKDSFNAMAGYYERNARTIPSQNGLGDGCQKVYLALIDLTGPVDGTVKGLSKALEGGVELDRSALASAAERLVEAVDGIGDAIVTQQNACLPKGWDSEDAYPLGLDGAKLDGGFATALQFLGHADDVNSLAWSLADRLQSLAASGKG